MSFPTAPLIFNVLVKREAGLLRFEDATLLVKYVHVDRLFPQPKQEHSDKGQASKTGAGTTSPAATAEIPNARTFKVREVLRVDGVRNKQAPSPLPVVWDVGDAGEWPHRRSQGGKYAEQRLVALTFKGKELTGHLGNGCKGNVAEMLDAIIEQGCLRLSVCVDGSVDVPLLIKVVAIPTA